MHCSECFNRLNGEYNPHLQGGPDFVLCDECENQFQLFKHYMEYPEDGVMGIRRNASCRSGVSVCNYHRMYPDADDKICGPIEKFDVTSPTKEAVNHPSHYGGKDNPYEHWKVARAWGLLENAFLYNATKYLCRVGKKDDAVQELRKAIWYIEKEIERLEGK